MGWQSSEAAWELAAEGRALCKLVGGASRGGVAKTAELGFLSVRLVLGLGSSWVCFSSPSCGFF